MDNLETPYEEEEEFIECTICDKTIRGETLYKIHLTAPGHLKVFHRSKIKLTAGNKEQVIFHHLSKPLTTFTSPVLYHLKEKEDDLVAAGHAVRKKYVPVFQDILHYLEYMKLDEPIIGLNCLDEYTVNDPQPSIRYACRLCSQHANLPEMVRHVIGRKHRQKYMEVKRPDLVTWNKQTIINHGGKIIRARAEIIERQDGRGTPTVINKRGTEGKLNISRVPPKQKQNRVRNFPQKEQDLPSLLPELSDYQGQSSHPGRYPPNFQNAPPFPPEDPYMRSRDRPVYQQEDTYSQNRREEERQRPDETYRRDYAGPDYHPEYEDAEDPQRRAALEPRSAPRYDSREEKPYGQAQRAEYYPDEARPQRTPYPERDELKEFYTEEVRRGQACSARYSPSQPLYSDDDEQQWSLDREPERHDSMNRAGRQGSSEPEGRQRSFPAPAESDRPRGSLYSMSRDYCHGMRDPRQEEADPGPSRTGPPTAQRRVETSRSMSDIPEPFRRFLTGADNEEGHGKRKRKSRFSDATEEEVKTTKEMFSGEYGPPNPKFAGRSRPAGVPLRPETQGPRHPDRYTSTNYQRGGSESGVFDMLNNIEIENAEEADFLKSKLCDLLKEFKTKKSGQAASNSRGRAAISEDYNSPDQELSPRNQYEPPHREDSDLRRPEGRYFEEDHRGRDWQQHDQIPDDRLQEYQRPARGEPRQSNRSRYEEVFGRPGMSQSRHDIHPDEPGRNPERFQEPRYPHNYRPAPEKFLDSRSSAPAHHMERGPRMDRGPRYSNNLDKITSTLLELVARK